MVRSQLQPPKDYTAGTSMKSSIPQDSLLSGPQTTMSKTSNLTAQATSPTNASTLAGDPKPTKYTDTVTQSAKK